MSASYLTRVVRLAFLAPDVIEAFLAGSARAEVDAFALLRGDAVSPHWNKQVARYLTG